MVTRRGIPGGWTTLTLAAWSALMLALWASGRLDLYLHPSFRPGVAVAGWLLALMVAGLCFLPSGEVPAEAPRPGKGPALGGWGLGVLVVPALAAAVLSPQGYSMTTLLNRGIAMDASVLQGNGGGGGRVDDLPLPREEGFSPEMAGSAVPENHGATTEEGVLDFFQYIEKSPEGAWRLEMLDLIYASGTDGLRQKLEREKIELTGQLVTKSPGSTPQRFSLVRFLMMCCAADARPVGVWVQRSGGTAGFQEMDWVQVTGRPTFPVKDGRRVVVIEIERMRVVEQPEEIFLFQ